MSNKRFTPNQLKRLANILDNAGQVVLASLVIPFALQLYEDSPPMLLWLGAIATITCWWLSLKIERISS